MGIGVGVGGIVEIGSGVAVGVTAGIGRGVDVGRAVGIGRGVDVGRAVGVGRGVDVGLGVDVGRAVGVGRGMGVGKVVGVGLGVNVGCVVGIGLGVDVGRIAAVGEAVGALGAGETGDCVSSDKAWVTPAAIVASTSSLVVDVSPQAAMHARSASATAAMRAVFTMAMSFVYRPHARSASWIGSIALLLRECYCRIPCPPSPAHPWRLPYTPDRWYGTSSIDIANSARVWYDRKPTD